MRRGLAVFDRLGRASVLRGAVSLVQLAALLVTGLVLPTPPAQAQSDPWALTPGLTARAVFSCDDLTLNNASTADSAPDAGQGHVGTNGRIALNSASSVLGNATPGPGKAVVRTGGSTVSGSTAPASVVVPCAPVSLTGLASTLPGSNANATIPRTTQNRDPLSGPSRTVFSMTSGDSLQLAAGTYYFTRFTLAGAAKVSVAGPVRIFVAGEIQLSGASWLNQNGNPANVRLFGNGPRLELTASSELNAFVYVPAAQVDLTNQSRIVGGLWAHRATLNASRVTKRTALSAPTLTITEPAEGATLPNLSSVAVSGVAQDAEGPVTLTLNGQTVSVGANGAFTATLDLSSTQPPAITAVAADSEGLTTVLVRSLGNCRQPTVRLMSPLPGALLGSRSIPVAVEADSATTVTVNGVAATLDAGVFRIAALDLMGDGLRTLQLNASNVCGSASATETVDVDTQVPIVALDTPVNGLVVATPTLSVGGTVSDAHLDTVTVNGVAAAITAGRFRADLALQPGPNALTAVARDRLGRQTTSNSVTVTYAPSSADFTLRTELRGQAVFSCEELKISGNAGTGALASAGPVAVAGDVVSGQGVSVEGNATVDGNASAGPGASVRVLGSARVLGQRRVLPSAPPCLPVDLAPIAAALAQTNDNATIGLTSQGRSPLGGPGGTEFTLQPGETLTLAPGAYYFTRFTVSPGASLSISGLVKILCAGEIDWRGSLNTTGSPYDLRVFSTGAAVGMQGSATARAFVYAPAATATLTGGELLGSLFARRVEIRGGARVVRRMDLAPPQLTLTAPLPGAVVGDLHQAVVAGTVTDADSPVVVRVNGLPAPVVNGTFSRTLDMSGVLPPYALVIAEDAAGQTAQLQATVCDGPPQVVLVSPAPGSVVGQRIVSVGGTCGTADTVLVNGIPATVVNGTFTLGSLDLGGEGDRPLVIAASGPCGPRTSNLLVNVDTLPPDVAIDRPAAGAWVAATPITVEGIVADPHLQSVRVGAVVASVAAGRFRAEGVVLAEGTTSLTAVATDVVGNQSTSAPVTVNLDSSPPVLTITAPSAGTVVSQVPVTVRGTSDDPLLEVRVGMATGTVDNTKQPPEWTVPGVALSEGDNTLTVDGRNLAGTPGTPPSLLLALDTQPPVVSLSSTGVPPFTALDRVTVSGSVFDAHLTSVTVNGVLAAVTGGTFTAQNVPLAEGPNSLVATARDAGGLQATSGTLTVTRDSVVPVIVLDALAQSLTNQRQLTVNGTITEANLTVITVNGVTATVTGNRFSATVPLTEGANAVRAHAEDLAGNVADSNTLSPELDTSPPAVAFSGLGLAASACAAGGASLTVSGTYGDVHPASSNAIAIELRPAGGGAPTSVPVTLDASGRAFTAPGVVLGTVDGTAILIATATDGAGNSAKAVFSQRVDATTPTVRIVLDGATFPGSGVGEVPGSSPTLLNRTLLPRAEVDDGSEAAPPVPVMTLDGSLYVAGTPIQAEGEHTLVARATDCAGHLAAASVRFVIDRTGPRLLTTTPAEGALSGQPVTTFSGTADVDLASAKLNGVAATVTGPAFTQTPFPWKEGSNAVRIELADAAGNVTAFDRTFRVKTLGPSIEILESGVPLATGALFYRTVTPAFRSNDPAAQIAVQLDGVAFTPGTVVSTPGERTLQATATDEAGHTASASVTFRIDLSAPPTVDITSPLEGAILPNPMTPVTGTAGASVTQVSVNGVPATGTTSWNAPAVPLDLDVPNDLRAVARDATGRTATAVRTVLSRSGGPKVVLIEPVDATRTNRRKIDVAGAVVGGAPFTANGIVTVTPQGGAALTVPLDPTGAFRAKDVPLQEGTTRIEVSATDAQGRTGTASVDVVTDFTAPAIALTVDGQAVSDGATYARAITVHVEVTDAGGALPPSVRLNGELLPVAGLSIDLPLQAAGGYVVAVIARDQAGNETRSERSLLVDLGGCGLADLTPESGTVIASNRVTLRGRAGSAASVTIRVPNPGSVPVTYADYPATVADGTFASADVPLPADGDNALQIVCTDRSGTAHTETLVLHRVSGAGPTITITSPANGAFVSTPGVTITGSVSDPSAKLTVNGLDVPLSNGQFTKTGFPLAEGPNVLSARAVDAASRVGEARVVVHRDTAPPQLAITSPQTNQVFGASGLSALAVEVSGVVDVFGEPNLQSVSVRLNGGAPIVATVDADSGVFRATVAVVVGPAAATHVVAVTATDALGQANVPAAQVSFSVDPLGPSILLNTPRDLARFTESASSVTAQGAARGAAGSVVSLNGQGIEGISFTSPGPDGRTTSPFAGGQPLPAEDGSFTLVARVDEPGTTGTGGAAGTPGKTASVRRVLVKDTVAPTVVQFVPAQDAGAAATLVEPDALLLVLFSEPIAKSSLPTADGLLLKKVGSTVPVAGTYTFSGNAVAFLPGAKLEPGAEYVFRAGAALTDLSAHPLAGPQEVRVKAALSPTDSAPQLDALPAIVCQTTLRVTGRSVPGALVRLRDDDLVFSAYADQAGVFAIDLPISGNGYHLLRVVNVARDGQSTGAAATALVRVDCSAPRVVSATFDRVAGLVRVDFSEPLDASTVQVGAETSSVRVSNGETMGSPAEAATLTLDAGARGLTLQLSTATDAFWRGRAVRLEVRPPAADPRGNPIAAFSTLFYPGAGPGDLSGSFLSGEVYDDESGRPLANALARLFTSTAALPGTGTEGMPVATGQTEARGRYGLAGDVPAGRYVLVLEKPGHTRVLRRFALEPQTGAVPFDARLTPLAAAAATPYAPPAAYTTEVASTLLKLDLAASALAGPGPLSVRLTALSGQGLPELLPLGYTPLAAAEVRLENAGAALLEATSFAPGTAFLTLPLRQAPDVSAQLLAARYDTATGQWLTLPLPQRSTGADGLARARVELHGPGAVAVLLADADPAIRPPQAPTQSGQPLAGSTLPATIPALTGALSLDPPTVPPTGRSTAKVVARSGDGTSPWPSGLAVQAFLDEKLVLATGEEVFEAPFAADLVLYHYPLTVAEQGTATAAAAGAAFFRVSPSERAAQERLQSGFENIRLFAFPSEIERGQILGPQGGSIAGTDGVELTVPEGALGRRTIVKARLLTTAELASYAAPEGFTLVTAVKVELEGQTLARQATLRLNVPQGTPPDTAGDPRLVLARVVEQAADGRSSYAGIVARGQRQAAQGSVPEKVTYAPEGGASTLPLAGLVEEGIYLVLRATASLGWATGLVKHESGAGVTNSRVSSPGLGTRDLSVPGGRYASAVLAGASRVVEALHPVNDERGSETLATVGIGEVVQRDITIAPQGPTIIDKQPASNAADQPIGTVVVVTFSEPLDGSTVNESTLRLELLGADGLGTGIWIAGALTVGGGSGSIVFTPNRPLPAGRRFRARFTGGVTDAGGTPYDGAIPVEWEFATSTTVTFGGQVDPTKIRLILPENGVSQIIGASNALPSVPSGDTPWAVTAEIEGAPSCASQSTAQASTTGSFSTSVGCAPAAIATIESRVFLRVFDPSGRLAHQLRLGPFVTLDGRGFVARAGEETRYVTVDGFDVTVPAAAFDSARLVTVQMVDPASLGVPIPATESLGAAFSVDFEGEARETLRLRIPAPANAVTGSIVLIGEPIDLPWGRKLRIRELGSVVESPAGKQFSTMEPDQPADPEGFSASPTLLRMSRPGELNTFPRRLLKEALLELGMRVTGALIHSTAASLAVVTGQSPIEKVGEGVMVVFNDYADTYVFDPVRHRGNWDGRFVLVVPPGQSFNVFTRDRATGFVVAQQHFDALSATQGRIVQLPTSQNLEFSPPVMIGASPFSITRFAAALPPGSVAATCEAVRLELEACTTSNGLLQIRSTPGRPLPDGSYISIHNASVGLTASSSAGPFRVQGGQFVDQRGDPVILAISVSQGHDILLAVGPGDLDAEGVTEFRFTFDRMMRAPTNASLAIRLDDCGEVGPIGGCPSPTRIPSSLEPASPSAEYRMLLAGELPRGHRFRLSFDRGQLVVNQPPGVSNPAQYRGPEEAYFETREAPGEPLSTSGAGSLGGELARDLVKLGNLLFVATSGGNIVAFDVSTARQGAVVAGATIPSAFERYAVMSPGFEEIRAMATDGHNRIFFIARSGSTWSVKAFRLEDARRPLATCSAAPAWAAGIPCFAAVDGGARVAVSPTLASGILASEFITLIGTLAQGAATGLELVTDDGSTETKELRDFFLDHTPNGSPAGFNAARPDSRGFYDFDVRLDTRDYLPNRDAPCEAQGEKTYDRHQRVTVENLTTAQSYSFDVENVSSSGGTAIATGIRARRGDRLRIRYSRAAIGYVAVIGSGITTIDANRFYRTTIPFTNLAGDCGRRLGRLERLDVAFPTCHRPVPPTTPPTPPSPFIPRDLFGTPAVAALPPTGEAFSASNPLRGEKQIHVFSPCTGYGAVHTMARNKPPLLPLLPETLNPGDLKAPEDPVCLLGDTSGHLEPVFLRSVAIAKNVTWWEPVAGGLPGQRYRKVGDLAFYSLGTAGVAVFDVSDRTLRRIGRLYQAGHHTYRLQVDPTGQKLFAGGEDPAGDAFIDVWDISRVFGNLSSNGQDPRLLLSLKAQWSTNHIAFDDSGAGLVYTWGPSDGGGRVLAVSDPDFVFAGLHRPEVDDPVLPGAPAAPHPELRPDRLFVPLGVPLRALPADEADPLKRKEDEKLATAAFRVRIALPGDFGDRLIAKVQSLREKPEQAHLGDENVGSAVGVPGGPGWPATEAFVTLVRLGEGAATEILPPSATNWQGEKGRLSPLYNVYESRDVVLLLADPRAREDYSLQALPDVPSPSGPLVDQVADEKSQCRRCERPTYLQQLVSTGQLVPDDIHEVLAAGPYLRAVLSVTPTDPTDPLVTVPGDPDARTNTQNALSFFAGGAAIYRRPSGLAEVSAWADSVPSPAQVSLVEPVLSRAEWESEDRGLKVLFTSGEIELPAEDYRKAGRGIAFAVDRNYRSGVLGYGPLGAAGWSSSLHSHFRRVPLFGDARRGQTQSTPALYDLTEIPELLEFHDGTGQVFRFLTPVRVQPPPPAHGQVPPPPTFSCPSGYELDGSYCVPDGLYLRLEKLDSGNRLRLIGANRTVRVFDNRGRLLEIRDRHRLNGIDPDLLGNTILFAYDGNGSLSTITDDYGRVHRFRYYADPVSDRERYGLLKEHQDFGGRTRRYFWGNSGQRSSRLLTGVAYPDTGSHTYSEMNPTLAYQYGVPTLAVTAPAHGEFASLKLTGLRLAGASQNRLDVEYQVASGRPKTIRVPNGGGSTVATSIVTNPPATRPPDTAVVTLPWGHDLSYLFAEGRVATISEDAPVLAPTVPPPATGNFPATAVLTSAFTYEADGRPKTTLNPAGLLTSLGYSTGDRLTRVNVRSEKRTETGVPPNQTARVREWRHTYVPGTNDLWKTEDPRNRLIVFPVPDSGASAPGPPIGRPSGFSSDGVGYQSFFDANGRETKWTGTGASAPIIERSYYTNVRGVVDKGQPLQEVRGAMTLRFSYDDAGNTIEKVTLPSGLVEKAIYDEWDRVVGLRPGETVGAYRATGAELHRSFDASGHLLVERVKKTPLGFVETLYAYDDRERVTSVTRSHVADGAGQASATAVTSYAFNAAGQLAAITSPEGIVSTIGHDPAGRVATMTTGVRQEQRQYDRGGRVVYRTDGDQGEWRGTFDAFGDLVHEVLPTGVHVRRTFDLAGNPETERMTSASGAVLFAETAYDINSFGKPRSVTQSIAGAINAPPTETRKTSYDYDSSGRFSALRTEGASGQRDEESLTYDTSNRLLSRRDATGNEELYTYVNETPWPDSVSLYEVGGQSVSSFFTRDALGRVVFESRTDGTSTTRQYDETGDIIAVQRPGMQPITMAWDSQGRLLSRSGPSPGSRTVMGYDREGRVTRTAVQAAGQVWETTYQYDYANSGRRTRTTYPDQTFEETTSFSNDDLPLVVLDRFGQSLRYTYDAANRLRALSPVGGPANVVKYELTWDYDLGGRLTSISKSSSATGRVSYEDYDLLGRPHKIVSGSGSAPAGSTLTLGLDTWDRPKSVRETAGRFWSLSAGTNEMLLGYDGLDRRIGASYVAAGATVLSSRSTYRGLASLESHEIQVPRPFVTARSYDSPAYPRTQSFSQATRNLGQISLDYRPGDRYKSDRRAEGTNPNQSALVPGQGLFGSMDYQYSPDPGLRLSSARAGDASDPLERFAFAMGPAREIAHEARSTVLHTQTTGSSGRVTSMDGDPYSTDAMGNRRSDERHDYTWSYRGELLSVTVKPGVPNAGAKVLYEYDVLGRLIERTHLGPLPEGQTSDVQRPFLDRRRYQWMGDHLLAEIRENQSGDMTWRRVMTPGPEGNRDTSQLLLQTFDPPEQKTYSFVRDEQGNVVALVDDAAPSGIAIPARYLYTPYGESHLERGPELRAIVYAASLTNVAGVAQNVVPNETVPGTLVVTTSIALTPSSLSGVDIQWRPTGSTNWSAAQQADFVIVHDETQATRLLLMRRDGWPKATEWRIRLTAALRDELGRSLQLPAPAAGSYDVDFDVDAGGVTPPAYRRSFPFVYETAAASASSLDGRIPGGMNYLFRGAWTDPVTGLAYMDGAWLDAESAAYLSEQGASDNLYAFEGRMPNEVTWAAGGWNPVERPPMGEPEFAYDGGIVEHQSLEMRVAKTLAIGVATVVVGVLVAPVAAAVISAMVTMSVMSSLTERIGEGQGIGEALIGSGKDLLPGRGVYEAATGRGLETGEELSAEDRIASAVEGLTDFFCVAEGTKVRTANGDFAIESLKVGDRVLSHRDVLGGEGETKNGVVDASPIEPSEPWYVLSLQTRHADHYGTAESEVKLLRPQSWLTSLNARIGTRLPISESESKEGQVAPVVGEAEITAIDPAPRKSDGAGRRILMTSKRIANEVYRIYTKEGRGSPLEVTAEHPLLVAGKGWTRAQDLQSGDQLVTGDLQVLPVERIETRAGPVVVYNVEVEADHTFLVAGSDNGPAVWVHNARVKTSAGRASRAKGGQRTRLNRVPLVFEGAFGHVSPSKIHDDYVNWVVGGRAVQRSIPMPWASSTGLGIRRLDHYDIATRTGFEGNTTPWALITPEKLEHKLKQVADDLTLIRTKAVDRVIWFGTEPLPSTGPAAPLREALKQSGIPYWVVRP